MSQNIPQQSDQEEQSASPQRGVWTTQRVTLGVLVLLALTFVVSSNCGPSDNTANPNNARTNVNANANIVANNASSAPPANAAGAPVPMPDKLKNTELKTLDGKEFKLADYQGKVLVVNLWASWCNPCRAEIPQIVQIYDDYKSRDVEVVGLTMEDDDNNTPDDVRRSVRDMKIDYRIAWAEKEFYASLLAPGYQIPQTYVIDRQGRIRKKFVGGGGHIGNFIRGVLDDILAEKT